MQHETLDKHLYLFKEEKRLSFYYEIIDVVLEEENRCFDVCDVMDIINLYNRMMLFASKMYETPN